MNGTVDQAWQSSLGKELTKEEVIALAEIMTPKSLADGDYLISEAGEETSLAVLREGDLAGELSFVDGTEHTVGLRALCDTVVLSLARADFEKVIEENPQLVYKVMRAVARSAHGIVRRMNSQFVELSNYVYKQHGRY